MRTRRLVSALTGGLFLPGTLVEGPLRALHSTKNTTFGQGRNTGF